MSPSDNNRPFRVGQLMQEQLGRILFDGLKDPRVGFVTVTEVRVTKDLRHARVFVSVYGDTEARNTSIEGLKAASGFIRRELGQSLRLRYVPEIEFCLDTSLDEAERLNDVLNAIADGATQTPEPQARDVVPVEDERATLKGKAAELEEARWANPRSSTERKGRSKRGGRKGRVSRGPKRRS